MHPSTNPPDGLSWEVHDGRLGPVLYEKGRRTEVTWAPQRGSQEAFLACPTFECLMAGPRGTGKTECFFMDFAQGVGQGWGSEWRGILFRRTYPELVDIVDKTERWFPRIFPGVKYNKSTCTWTWPSGETLRLAYMRDAKDYWSYHGHNYAWIGWEELTTWPTDECYTKMISCCRSANKSIPIRIRSTTNPAGVGHNWVKQRFKLPIHHGRIVGPLIDEKDEEGQSLPGRRAIQAKLSENKVLLHANPNYVQNIKAAARNEAERRAWVDGDWDIVAGGMFDDVWDKRVHVVRPFEIPRSWYADRSFDWGSSRPFSVCWWAESDGSDVTLPNGQVRATVRGDIFLFAESYGWTGKPNEGVRMDSEDIAKLVASRETKWGLRVRPGPADNAIFVSTEGESIAAKMAKQGINWTKSDKSPGSRVAGWDSIRLLLKNAKPSEEGPRERPGLFIFDECEQFLRTIPFLSRDSKNPDDVDTDTEDHIADATRYRVHTKKRRIVQRGAVGMH